ncbi:MAG: phage/plasmid primase, P4 family [Pseudomonadota bacterium]|nr:phage/plasmid primase, P4 family [Pseudomonadota bacterium]
MTDAIVEAVREAETLPPAPSDKELAKLPRNDTGNARRLIARHGHEMAWVKEIGWLVWDGRRWARENGEELALIRAQQVVDALYVEAETLPDECPEGEDKRKGTPRARHYNFAVSSGNGGKTKSIVEMAAPRLKARQDSFDARHYHFNVQNGTLRLDQGGKLYGHRPCDRATRLAAVAYDPKAECPEFERFVATILPDFDTALFVQKYLGYSLTGDISEQCMVMLEGKGANGKSTLMNVIARVMGDYAANLPIESLLHNDKGNGSGPSPDLARLPGARLIRTSEPEPGARLSESRIKQLTGGEDVTARDLNKGFMDFVPTGKIAMSFNVRPSIVGKDHGTRRRIHVVPFKHRFEAPKGGRKVDYAAKFVAEEGPGILNWLLEGLREWLHDGLTVPREVREATDDMFTEQDPIGQAMKDILVETGDPDSMVQATVLFNAYELWSKRQGEEAKKQTAMGRRLKDMGYRKKQHRGLVYYIGVSLNPDYITMGME